GTFASWTCRAISPSPPPPRRRTRSCGSTTLMASQSARRTCSPAPCPPATATPSTSNLKPPIPFVKSPAAQAYRRTDARDRDIMVSKYFRKAGVPQSDPATGSPLRDGSGNVVTGPEKSAKEVIHRLSGCWRYWGEKYGYFDTPEDAQAFYDELAYMLLHQMCA